MPELVSDAPGPRRAAAARQGVTGADIAVIPGPLTAETPRPACQARSVDNGLQCTEQAGHRDAGWHYDELNDVTFRPGCFLPGPEEG